jgi:hypothetical protein
MAHLKVPLLAVLAAASTALAGCYETRAPVLGHGQEAPFVAGTYRCQNEKDREVSTATLSAPARLGADDVVYLATLDKDRYAVRVAALPGDLFLLEARGDFQGARHIFVRRQGDAYDLMVASTQAQTQLAALARTHGVKIEFHTYGTPDIDGPPERERAFLLAHTPAELQRTATCRRVP